MCDRLGCNAATFYRVQFAEDGRLVSQDLCATHGAVFLFNPEARVEQVADSLMPHNPASVVPESAIRKAAE